MECAGVSGAATAVLASITSAGHCRVHPSKPIRHTARHRVKLKPRHLPRVARWRSRLLGDLDLTHHAIGLVGNADIPIGAGDSECITEAFAGREKA